MKKCSTCGSSTNEFPKRKASKDGLATECKACKNERNKKTYHADERVKQQTIKRAYRNMRTRKEDPVYRNSHNVWHSLRQRDGKIVPDWVCFHDFREVYEKCHEKGADKYVVDHIYPIKGKNVCGLHVPENLQVITHKQNLAKSNR